MRLDIRLIVPGTSPGEILLAADGTLPRITADGDVDQASVTVIDEALRNGLGLIVPILESHPRWPGVTEGDAIPTLATTEAAPATWQPPPGLAFGPLQRTLDDVPEAVRARANQWIAELQGDAEPSPLRPRWSRPGWSRRAGAWMARAAAAAGRPLTGEPRVFYLRGISALLRAPTADGDVYLKAVFPPFHAEPTITAWLAKRAGPRARGGRGSPANARAPGIEGGGGPAVPGIPERLTGAGLRACPRRRSAVPDTGIRPEHADGGSEPLLRYVRGGQAAAKDAASRVVLSGM